MNDRLSSLGDWRNLLAAFASMWGSGALVGAIIAGWGMEGFGPHGLLYVLAVCFVIFLIAMAVRTSTMRT